MSTPLRRDGFRFVIRSNDHNPSHVHVEKAGVEALFNLGDENTRPSLREVRGMKYKDIYKAFEIVCEEQDLLLQEWRKIHGKK